MHYQFLDYLYNVLLVSHSCDQLQRPHPDGLILILYTVHDDIPGERERPGEREGGEVIEREHDTDTIFIKIVSI